jgi:hypothetical protein
MLNEPKDPADVGVTREDLEQTLDANGYYRGPADEDPEKDATHIWYSSDNRRYVKFTIPTEDGQVLYGDAGGDAYIPYNSALLVLSGLMTLAEAKKPKFVLPANVAAKLTAARAASTAAALPGPETDEDALALPERADEEAPPRAASSGSKLADRTAADDRGVFEPVKGDKGVF